MLLRATFFLLIVALGASSAWWINHFVGQRAANAPPPAGVRPLGAGSTSVAAPELTAARVAALFGESSAAAVVPTTATSSLANVTLRGVYAPAGDGERGESGFAVFFLDGKEQRSVRPGEAIRPGVTLVAVKANSAVVDVSGVRQTLALDAPLAGGSSSFRPALPPAPIINIAPPGPPPAVLPTGGLPNTPSSAIGAAAAAALAASNKASGK